MPEWELTEEERSLLRKVLIILGFAQSADRDIAMIKFGEQAAQKKLVEWIDLNLFQGEYKIHWGNWQELRKGVGLE